MKKRSILAVGLFLLGSGSAFAKTTTINHSSLSMYTLQTNICTIRKAEKKEQKKYNVEKSAWLAVLLKNGKRIALPLVKASIPVNYMSAYALGCQKAIQTIYKASQPALATMAAIKLNKTLVDTNADSDDERCYKPEIIVADNGTYMVAKKFVTCQKARK